MAIITLTTDYGNKDYSVSSLKAKLISNIDNIKIVDISHDISPFNPVSYTHLRAHETR